VWSCSLSSSGEAALVAAGFQLLADLTDFQKDVSFPKSDFRLLV
jgi:hypothetical protein